MIKLDPKNARVHSEDNKELISKSLQELGVGRSIVIDSEDYVVAGNGVFEESKKLGIKTKVIESDGTELIVIKRTDLKYDDKKRRQLAIADNATGETSEWNFEELTVDEIEEWEVDTGGVDVDISDMQDGFSLQDGDKSPFQQITFTLSDKQTEIIKEALQEVEVEEWAKDGNENRNGNKIYQIVCEWVEQRT